MIKLFFYNFYLFNNIKTFYYFNIYFKILKIKLNKINKLL